MCHQSETSVIYAFINRVFKILTKLEMEKMFIEVDQTISNKLLDAMFKMSEDGHHVFLKLILCMLKTILSRFKDSGIIKLFVYSGISGKKTIEHAFKGRDVKIYNKKKVYIPRKIRTIFY